MVGNLVPQGNAHWKNFCLLLTIMDYLFSPSSSASIAACVRVLVDDHHQQFKCGCINNPKDALHGSLSTMDLKVCTRSI